MIDSIYISETKMSTFLRRLNMLGECRALDWSLWQCPPFLFMVLGFVTITSMVAASVLSYRFFEDPEIPTIVVTSLLAVIFLIIGNFIINGFNRIAEANRMKTQFISIISHQLRSPLSIFKWTLEAFDRTAEKSADADTQNLTKSLHDATEQMIRLVNTLLDISRIETRSLILKTEPVSLEDVTRSSLKNFNRYAVAAQKNFVFNPPKDLPDVVVDRARVTLVIDSLIDNAIRYTTGGSTISIQIERVGAKIRWTIEDKGIGIPNIQQKYIFQKFFRANNSLQSQTEGTGIGLYIARSVIIASGGSMGFTSEENKGSLFWFMLPIAKK